MLEIDILPARQDEEHERKGEELLLDKKIVRREREYFEAKIRLFSSCLSFPRSLALDLQNQRDMAVKLISTTNFCNCLTYYCGGKCFPPCSEIYLLLVGG